MEKNGWAVRGSWLMFLRERQMVFDVRMEEAGSK